MSELNTHFRRHALLLSQRDRVCSQLVKLEAVSVAGGLSAD